MLKPGFLCYIATTFLLCLILFTTCKESSDTGTWVEFNNLEQFPVTVYSDPARQVVFAEVKANDTMKVSATPNSVGTAYYPTFKLDLFNIPGISVSYNGPSIIAVIEADKTNTVPIPKLTSVETNSAYIKLTNNSNSSLTLQQGNAEKSPLGGGSSVIASGSSAAYEIAPGPVSGYSIMHNTVTPVAFPTGLTEFKAGRVYTFTYNGTALTLSSQDSVTTGAIVPGSGLAAKLDWLKNNAVSNYLYNIEIYADENIVPQNLSYSNKSGITITLSGSETMRTVNLSAQGSLFTVNSGVTLILDNNITLKGRYNNSALVSINKGGTLVMNAGVKIIGNTNDDYGSPGGGVYNEGTFNMNGGEISSNNTDRKNGGGVYVYGGIFTMNGGKISGNYSSYGGGVNVDSRGTFAMKDGEISGNRGYYGGGVNKSDSLDKFGNFSMSGGVIYGDNAAENLKNTARYGSVHHGPRSQYGTFSGDTFYSSGDLDYTINTTIRVVNGNLLRE
jgi:hypothetical protein